MYRALLTSAAVAMFAACSESVDPIGEDASFNFSNGPESPGPFIVREVETGFFILFNDDRASRLVSLVRACVRNDCLRSAGPGRDVRRPSS